ncbi:MAG: tetratricopeptide repeat protein, partial [Kiloniellales bacterium]
MPHHASRYHKGRGALAIGLLLILCAAPAGPAAAAKDDSAKGPARYRDLLQGGTVNNNLGRFELAEQSFREALAVCEEAFGAGHPDCGDAMTRLALEISNQERYEEADLAFQRAEPLVRQASSPLDHPRYLTYLAMDMANRRQYAEAFDLAAKANQLRQGSIQITVAAAGKGEPGAKQALDNGMGDLAHGLYVQASILVRLERYEEARVTAHLARRLIMRVKSVPTWWTAIADELLALIDLRENDIESAEKRLQLALETKRVALGNTRAVALSHLALGAVYNEGQRDLAALKAMRPGLAIVNKELGEVPGVDVERLIP